MTFSALPDEYVGYPIATDELGLSDLRRCGCCVDDEAAAEAAMLGEAAEDDGVDVSTGRCEIIKLKL